MKCPFELPVEILPVTDGYPGEYGIVTKTLRDTEFVIDDMKKEEADFVAYALNNIGKYEKGLTLIKKLLGNADHSKGHGVLNDIRDISEQALSEK